jgi:hypothetical protein
MAGESGGPDLAEATARMHSKLGARRELQALPAHLRERETVERIATWMDSGARTGIIVVTDQRLFALRSTRSGDIVDDFPYDKISSIRWMAGRVQGTMTVILAGATHGVREGG